MSNIDLESNNQEIKQALKGDRFTYKDAQQELSKLINNKNKDAINTIKVASDVEENRKLSSNNSIDYDSKRLDININLKDKVSPIESDSYLPFLDEVKNYLAFIKDQVDNIKNDLTNSNLPHSQKSIALSLEKHISMIQDVASRQGRVGYDVNTDLPDYIQDTDNLEDAMSLARASLNSERDDEEDDRSSLLTSYTDESNLDNMSNNALNLELNDLDIAYNQNIKDEQSNISLQRDIDTSLSDDYDASIAPLNDTSYLNTNTDNKNPDNNFDKFANEQDVVRVQAPISNKDKKDYKVKLYDYKNFDGYAGDGTRLTYSNESQDKILERLIEEYQDLSSNNPQQDSGYLYEIKCFDDYLNNKATENTNSSKDLSSVDNISSSTIDSPVENEQIFGVEEIVVPDENIVSDVKDNNNILQDDLFAPKDNTECVDIDSQSDNAIQDDIHFENLDDEQSNTFTQDKIEHLSQNTDLTQAQKYVINNFIKDVDTTSSTSIATQDVSNYIADTNVSYEDTVDVDSYDDGDFYEEDKAPYEDYNCVTYDDVKDGNPSYYTQEEILNKTLVRAQKQEFFFKGKEQLRSEDFYPLVVKKDPWFSDIYNSKLEKGPISSVLEDSIRIFDQGDESKWIIKTSKQYKNLLGTDACKQELERAFSSYLGRPISISFDFVNTVLKNTPKDFADKEYMLKIENTKQNLVNNKYIAKFIKTMDCNIDDLNVFLYKDATLKKR